jgi:hypothetical protein
MGHRIVNAIIENGQLKYVGEELPEGRLEVHLIYDTADEHFLKGNPKNIVKKTSGIYQGIDAGREAKKLRRNWERDVWK